MKWNKQSNEKKIFAKHEEIVRAYTINICKCNIQKSVVSVDIRVNVLTIYYVHM